MLTQISRDRSQSPANETKREEKRNMQISLQTHSRYWTRQIP